MAAIKKYSFLLVFFCLSAMMNAQKSTGDDVIPQSPLDIFVPNAFTPNGDGLNDSFKTIINGPELDLYEFTILDRFGKEVFYSTNPDEYWDGTTRGGSYTTGATLYIYIMKIKSVEDPGPNTLKGHVVLIR